MTAGIAAGIAAGIGGPGGIVDALGWTLVHFLWQGAAAGLVTALVLAMLRDARPHLRYLAACAGLLACVLWPAVTLALRLRGGMAVDAAQDVQAAQPAFQLGAQLTDSLQRHMAWIVAAWAACCVTLLTRTALGMAWIVRAGRHGARDPHWQAQLDRLAAAMGVARHVRLRIVQHLASPVTAGCRHPLVLVPASLLTGMPPALLHALLAHEMAHIRRHDYLVNLLQNLAEMLLFYHPAVWWISRRIRCERELIADDIAAGPAGGPRRLAQALSELEKSQFVRHEPALAADGGDLMNRIARLLRPAPRRNLPAAVSAALAAVLPTLALAGAFATGLARAGDEPIVDRPQQRGVVDFASCAKPVWPQASLAAQQTGTVTLAFLVDERGVVHDSQVRKSSGHPALDEAARDGIAKCSFHAGRQDGAPVKSWVMLQYAWVLE